MIADDSHVIIDILYIYKNITKLYKHIMLNLNSTACSLTKQHRDCRKKAVFQEWRAIPTSNTSDMQPWINETQTQLLSVIANSYSAPGENDPILRFQDTAWEK